MSQPDPAVHGRVGPDHARRPALLRILETGAPTHSLTQKVVATGPGYRLLIATPKAPPPAAGYPLLYMLDGNAAFDFLTPEHLALVPGLAIVGVGHDTERQFARSQRILDFTPPDGPGDGLRPDHVDASRTVGGAKMFRDRLTGILRTEAEAGLPVDPARRTLWGHSFGGLFTLYAMLTSPEAFARYAAISPSIWWDEALMRRIADAAAPASRPLLVALGDREKRSGSSGPPPDGPAPATMNFIADLARHPGHRADPHVLAGHVHIETLAGSFPLALPFAAS